LPNGSLHTLLEKLDIGIVIYCGFLLQEVSHFDVLPVSEGSQHGILQLTVLFRIL